MDNESETLEELVRRKFGPLAAPDIAEADDGFWVGVRNALRYGDKTADFTFARCQSEELARRFLRDWLNRRPDYTPATTGFDGNGSEVE